MQTSPFITPSAFIILTEILQPHRLFCPSLLFETRDYLHTYVLIFAQPHKNKSSVIKLIPNLYTTYIQVYKNSGRRDWQTDKNGCFHWTLISPSWNLNCWAQLQELIAVYQGHIWNPKILDGVRFSQWNSIRWCT